MATELTADLDAGRLEGIAVLCADRDDLIAVLDIAQLPVDLLAHGAVGGELDLHGLAVARCDGDGIARYSAHGAGRAAALAAEAALATLPAALSEELLGRQGPVLCACAPADDLPAVEACARHQQQRDNPDNSFP